MAYTKIADRSGQIHKMATRAKNRNILKLYLFCHRPKHHLMYQDSGEQSRALGLCIILPHMFILFEKEQPVLIMYICCFMAFICVSLYNAKTDILKPSSNRSLFKLIISDQMLMKLK